MELPRLRMGTAVIPSIRFSRACWSVLSISCSTAMARGSTIGSRSSTSTIMRRVSSAWNSSSGSTSISSLNM
uniref:AT09760p1 n=1 Tax=Drosophila melanogaster TaxID=7227 RepID=G4LU31_DROME|nr:AT09760p1 [Drosophila melanogaster]